MRGRGLERRKSRPTGDAHGVLGPTGGIPREGRAASIALRRPAVAAPARRSGAKRAPGNRTQGTREGPSTGAKGPATDRRAAGSRGAQAIGPRSGTLRPPAFGHRSGTRDAGPRPESPRSSPLTVAAALGTDRSAQGGTEAFRSRLPRTSPHALRPVRASRIPAAGTAGAGFRVLGRPGRLQVARGLRTRPRSTLESTTCVEPRPDRARWRSARANLGFTPRVGQVEAPPRLFSPRARCRNPRGSRSATRQPPRHTDADKGREQPKRTFESPR
jgi:hypothetical protein